MALLVKNDYKTLIREKVLDVIIEDDENFLDIAELAATEEMISYLNARFDTAAIFRNTKIYTLGAAFTISDFIHLTASAYTATVYQVGDLVSFTDGNVYKCIQLTTGPEAPISDPTFFELWGVQNGFYTDLVGGAGNKPADGAKFTYGDTRSQLIIRYLVDITVFELHSRINPRNIPDLRVDRRADVIAWLSKVSKPRNEISPDLPLKVLVDQKGLDISWGTIDTTRNRY